jgi:hypothetical protein
MITSWIWINNLRPFLSVLAWTVVYDFDPDDWVAISHGIVGTNDEEERWFGYEFSGQHRAEFMLAFDAESDLVHLRISLPESLVPRIETAISIFSHFHVADPGA